MITHYLPPFGDRPDRWGYQAAVCGARILAKDHSTEPVCTICKNWLVEDDAIGASLCAPIDKDDPLMQPVAPQFFDNITGESGRR